MKCLLLIMLAAPLWSQQSQVSNGANQFTNQGSGSISYSGNIGLGTTSPGYAIDIENGAIQSLGGTTSPANREINIQVTVSSITAGQAYFNMLSSATITDTTAHQANGDGSHFGAVVGWVQDQSGTQTQSIAMEGRITGNAFLNSGNYGIPHWGILGYPVGINPSSTADTSMYAAFVARPCITTSANCAGTYVNKGSVVGFYTDEAFMTGGLYQYGLALTTGTYNFMAGYLGIGNANWFGPKSGANPPAPLSVQGEGADFTTIEMYSTGSSNPAILGMGRTAGTIDAYYGISGGGSFVNSSSAGDTILRAQGKNIWMTGNSGGTTNGFKINSTDGVTFQKLTKANIQARTPGEAGEMVQCTNCTVPFTVCVATASASADQYSLMGAALAACQ